MTIEAWNMDDDTATDQRKPHRLAPSNPVSESDLREVGVLSWSLDADKYKDDPVLEKVWTLSWCLCVLLFMCSLPPL